MKSACGQIMQSNKDLNEAISQVRDCSMRMDAAYGRTVFDEWAIVSLLPHQGRVLDYKGPRHEKFASSFSEDLAKLRQSLVSQSHDFGQFEFARNGEGSQFDAFMCIGEGVYLMCNNLFASMEDITRDEKWYRAQVPFVEMSEQFRSNPVTFTA
jgi:hypothetical protein